MIKVSDLDKILQDFRRKRIDDLDVSTLSDDAENQKEKYVGECRCPVLKVLDMCLYGDCKYWKINNTCEYKKEE